MTRKRVPYAQAGEAMRSVLARASRLETGSFKRSDWRVLATVMAMVAGYSRVEDDLFIAQLAEAAGVSERTAGASLRRLAELGIIGYSGRRGQGRPPRVSLFPAPQTGNEDCRSETGEEDCQSGRGKQEESGTLNRNSRLPDPEKDREENDDDGASKQPSPELKAVEFTDRQWRRIEANVELAEAWLAHGKGPGAAQNLAAFVVGGVKSGKTPRGAAAEINARAQRRIKETQALIAEMEESHSRAVPLGEYLASQASENGDAQSVESGVPA